MLGAGGFIGRWTVRALAARGARVVALARQAEPARLLFDSAGVTCDVLEADLTRAHLIPSILLAIRPAVVFNLAGYGVDPLEREPAMAESINSVLPAELAHCFEPQPGWTGQHLVHAGSALEYGTATGDLSEASLPLPSTLYGSSKLSGTVRMLSAARQRAVRAAVARLFTVYGPGELAGRLLPTLLSAATSEAPIPLSEGRQQRDFVYVEDVAEALVRLAELPDEDVGIVNVATGRLASVRDFTIHAASVLGISAKRLQFGALPTRPEEMAHDPVNVSKLRRLTGWLPETEIEEGIRRAASL